MDGFERTLSGRPSQRHAPRGRRQAGGDCGGAGLPSSSAPVRPSPLSGRLHHLALRVSDCDRSAAFYGGLLGLRERRRLTDGEGGLRAVWLEAGEVVVMLERRLRGCGPEQGSGHLLSLAVDDLEAWRGRLLEAGVPIDDSTPTTLFVRDPDGHRVGLSTYRF